MKIDHFIKSLEEELISIRRQIHMNPELSKLEFETQKLIVNILEKYKITYELAATTGVVATIKGKQEGKVIALRADIDALPIQEQNEIPYKSINDGVMHACGHDAHTTILLGVAITLQKYKDTFNGTVKCLFQPNEEVSSGAKDLVREGYLDDVDDIIGLHCMPYIETGEIEIKHGQLNASSGVVVIEVLGKSSHGAYPETGIDAIMISSVVLQNLQTIFTRNLSPLEQAVLSFGKIEGGVASNVIAQKVTLRGTLRTTTKEVRERIKDKIVSIAKNTAQSFGGDVNITFHDGYIALINDDDITDIIIDTAKKVLGSDKINYKKHPSMGVEDFGYYQEKARGAFYHLGCGNKEKNITSLLHTDTFNIDESCLYYGTLLQVETTLKLLKGAAYVSKK